MDEKAASAKGEIRVVEFSLEMLGQATEVLTEAFKTEETTAYHLDTERPSTLRAMRILDGIMLRLYLDAGRPLFAAMLDGGVAGMAMVSDPRLSLSWRRAAYMFMPHLPRIAALFLRHPLRVLRVIVKGRQPKGLTKPHITFEALGVHPDHQGRGAGSGLMRRVQDLARDDPAISGIYLNTGSEKNEAFYRFHGYTTLKVADLGEVKIYHMFWPNPSFPPHEQSA